MRKLARGVRLLQDASRLRRAEGLRSQSGTGTLEHAYSYPNTAGLESCRPSKERFILKFLSGAMPLRTFATSVADTNATDIGKAGPLSEYERRIASAELLDGDDNQIETIQLLHRLYNELCEFEDTCKLDRYSASQKSERSRWLWSRFVPQSSKPLIKGLYLYGGVGTGKTMLMDLFFDQLPCNWRKKRIHFHDFMLNVHSRLQKHKGLADPLDVVAGEISDDSILLCLDEFMVTDVADALILNRLFEHLFNKGVILVATSNRAPDKLYEGGLQRDLFLPFIENLKDRCEVHEIGSVTDYRKMTSAEQGFYFVGNKYSDLLKQKFYWLSGKQTASSEIVEVIMGRRLQVPLASGGCAYFQFEDLCDKPLGAADYFGLFKKFHTLALEGVPRFGLHNRTAGYRFVTLIDTSAVEIFGVDMVDANTCLETSVMYESKARLLCTADASPVELFDRVMTVADAQRISPRTSSRSQKIDNIDICVDNELGFAKDRTISRLTEMNSKEYLEQNFSILEDDSQETTGSANAFGT